MPQGVGWLTQPHETHGIIPDALSPTGHDAILRDPKGIEDRSFAIIDGMIGHMGLSEAEKAIVRRVVHTTGDPSVAGLVYIGDGAIGSGLTAIRSGCDVFCDVNMVVAGIRKDVLGRFGGRAVSLVHEPVVAEEARRQMITRSAAAVIVRARETGFEGEVVAVGNAPTALFTLVELVRLGKARPALVVGVPVGFVGAKESKEALERCGVPCITVRGSRGGSNVAAAVMNALLLMA